MTIEELTVMMTSGVHLDIEIHAVNPMVYVVYQQFAGRRSPLRNASGESVQFRSRYAALSALANAGVRKATFIHRSAYGEMIGLDGAVGETELRETIHLPAP